ncbi:MAG TPA: hypothetical protein VL595_06965 [Pseudonocardia sp.]|nr:hypothetical protein [Pseudonocardia sp.]
MSFIDTLGTSGRLRTLAQNLAITMESTPKSSKKWASVDTSGDSTTSARISA